MRKICGGHLYNTETAQFIATAGDSLRDFYASCESLYRSKSGLWFLHGESSAGGQYGRVSSNGGEMMGGAEIIPLSEAAVLLWAEEHRLDDDAVTTIAALLALDDA